MYGSAKVCDCQLNMLTREFSPRGMGFTCCPCHWCLLKIFSLSRVVYAPLQLVMALIWHSHTNTAPLRNQFVQTGGLDAYFICKQLEQLKKLLYHALLPRAGDFHVMQRFVPMAEQHSLVGQGHAGVGQGGTLVRSRSDHHSQPLLQIHSCAGLD